MYTKTLNLSIILALIVVVLGAYTRLADAGLGCPDWPGVMGNCLFQMLCRVSMKGLLMLQRPGKR